MLANIIAKFKDVFDVINANNNIEDYDSDMEECDIDVNSDAVTNPRYGYFYLKPSKKQSIKEVFDSNFTPSVVEAALDDFEQFLEKKQNGSTYWSWLATTSPELFFKLLDIFLEKKPEICDKLLEIFGNELLWFYLAQFNRVSFCKLLDRFVTQYPDDLDKIYHSLDMHAEEYDKPTIWDFLIIKEWTQQETNNRGRCDYSRADERDASIFAKTLGVFINRMDILNKIFFKFNKNNFWIYLAQENTNALAEVSNLLLNIPDVSIAKNTLEACNHCKSFTKKMTESYWNETVQLLVTFLGFLQYRVKQEMGESFKLNDTLAQFIKNNIQQWKTDHEQFQAFDRIMSKFQGSKDTVENDSQEEKDIFENSFTIPMAIFRSILFTDKLYNKHEHSESTSSTSNQQFFRIEPKLNNLERLSEQDKNVVTWEEIKQCYQKINSPDPECGYIIHALKSQFRTHNFQAIMAFSQESENSSRSASPRSSF